MSTLSLQPDRYSADDRDVRVEDYLDDQLQSSTDLDNLDDLLANVELQRGQLQTQLDTATRELEDARREADSRQGSLQEQIESFRELQRSIDVRLEIVAKSDAPDEAVRRLEAPMGQLRKVDLAYKYLLLLQDVEALAAEAKSHLPQDPKAALEPYSRLKQMSTRLRELQGPADEAAGHLVRHVGQVTESLWAGMKKTMWDEYESVLSQRKWPNVDAELEVDDEWRSSFEKLVDLQVPEVLFSEQIVALLPLDVMAQIFIKEFRFHFLSDRRTSNPMQIGEVCFPWFIDRVEKWEDFLRDNFGYSLVSRFQDTAVSGKMVYMDPVCAFITALLPVMREKIDQAMAEALKSPSFLSSLMAQLMKFDDEIRQKFSYDGGDEEKGWRGLASEVLDKHFDEWLQAERDFALGRFEAIMSNLDGRNIDYDYNGPGKTKPTYHAVRVMDLLRTITTQYERVRRFSHKLKFLIDIQIDILDAYHDRLRGSLEAYYSITSTVGRTLHGVSKEQAAALEGVGTFETLCKVFGSADHVVNCLRDWSNEEFFVSLWDELQRKAQQVEGQDNLAGGMSYDAVKDRTSSAVGTDDAGGALFDETTAAYAARRKSAQEYLVSALIDSHYKAFRPYLYRAQWTTINEDPAAIDPQQLAITAELDEPLRILKRNLEFLSRALGTATFRRIFRDALEKLQEALWADILTRQSFTTFGAAQFLHDIRAVASLVDRYIPDGGSGALETLTEGAVLLNLPLEQPPREEGSSGGSTAAPAPMTLKQATDRVFTDNSEAKKVLEELGIGTLTPANARNILQRRVENSE
ncbi:uncharacterized protein E0L32_002719 [Thyridium curvatum]|uniref:RAD50-interacting protein 1 n=1 Tax=Thyridium curvatum TaxID=1093900 RepID=A0A507BN82_9PEZI|nr:uncharacterized protein E0L32_002719 [Thyridium curvatum]TPX18210.1 hypothetical protein E0L32_002719 [Thyridium curvatum]